MVIGRSHVAPADNNEDHQNSDFQTDDDRIHDCRFLSARDEQCGDRHHDEDRRQVEYTVQLSAVCQLYRLQRRCEKLRRKVNAETIEQGYQGFRPADRDCGGQARSSVRWRRKSAGGGGGRPDMAEAGGKNPEALDSALEEVYTVVDSLLGA